MRTIHLAAIAVAVTAGCAQESNARLSLQGQMLSETVVTTPNPLTLAIAWYTTWFGQSPGAPPKEVVVQEASFQGSFPLSFTFEVHGPPPADAMVGLAATGGTGSAAYGVLIAFEDLNRNGGLDLGTSASPSPDRVAGISIPDPSLPPPLHTYFVIYLDGSVARDDYLGAFKLEQGYNLLEIHSDYGVQPVPSETQIGIHVTNTDALGVYSCADADFSLGLKTSCGIDPYGGKYRLYGSLWGYNAPSQIEIDDANGPRGDATLVLNGVTATYEPQSSKYIVQASPGPATLEISVPGHPAETMTTTIPGPVMLTSPLPASLPSGSTISLSWTADPAVELYDIYVLDADFKWLAHGLTTGTSLVTDPIHHTGPVSVSVKGLAPLAVGSNGSFLTPLNRSRGTIDFTP